MLIPSRPRTWSDGAEDTLRRAIARSQLGHKKGGLSVASLTFAYSSLTDFSQHYLEIVKHICLFSHLFTGFIADIKIATECSCFKFFLSALTDKIFCRNMK